MGELNIKERQVGDVTILDLDGRLNIGEGGVALLNCMRRLKKENKQKIVLNLAGLRYIDSSGTGVLIASYTTMMGGIKLASPTQFIQDRLVIQKLMTVFDAYEDVEEAVKAFASKDSYVSCPVRGCDSSILLFSRSLIGTCSNCGTEVSLKPLPSGASDQVSINSLRFPTYENEHISIYPGTTTTIHIVGRLDLLVSEVLEKAWCTVPPPRRVVFRIGAPRDISEPGMQKLLALCANRAEDSASVILASSKEQTFGFSFGSPVYDEEHRAISALGKIPSSAQWTLDIRR